VNPTADSRPLLILPLLISTRTRCQCTTAHHRDQEAPWPRSARRRRGELVVVCDAKCPDNNGGAVGEGGIRSIGSIGPGRRCDETQMQIMVRYGPDYLSSKFYRTAAQCASRSHTNEGKSQGVRGGQRDGIRRHVASGPSHFPIVVALGSRDQQRLPQRSNRAPRPCLKPQREIIGGL
jgi:hypothetical protein